MAITQADQHAGSLTEYCATSYVETMLAGIAQDDDGQAFRSVMTGSQFHAKCEEFLPMAKETTDDIVGHDFDHHENVDIKLDGEGTEILRLSQYGFVPLLSVSSITINESSENTTNFKVYKEGFLKRYYHAETDETVITGVASGFPIGRQNVELTITWGYTSVPRRVKIASAYLVGSYLMEQMDVMQDLNQPGIFPAFQRVSMGDTSVTTSSSGVYRRAAERLENRARRQLRRYQHPIIRSPQPKAATSKRGETYYAEYSDS